jgi:hypothetical protein
MIVLPIPPFLLDVLFSFNIALALIVLLVAIYTDRPLDFAAFPTVLLVATLLRLALEAGRDSHQSPSWRIGLSPVRLVSEVSICRCRSRSGFN